MKNKIIIELDKMINDGEKVTYRELGKRLDTVASTITYQFGSKDKLIEYYLDYKFTEVYHEKVFTSFTDLMLFSYKTNKNFLGNLSDEITVSALANIQSTLLSKHYNSFQQLYIKQYGEENNDQMIQYMSLVQLMALNPKFYGKMLGFDANDEQAVFEYITNLTK